jgi:hypothetical protein
MDELSSELMCCVDLVDKNVKVALWATEWKTAETAELVAETETSLRAAVRSAVGSLLWPLDTSEIELKIEVWRRVQRFGPLQNLWPAETGHMIFHGLVLRFGWVVSEPWTGFLYGSRAMACCAIAFLFTTFISKGVRILLP